MSKKLTQSEAGKLGSIAAQATFVTRKQERIDKYNENPTLCQTCNKILDYKKRNNKFCDHSCAAIFNNKITKLKHGNYSNLNLPKPPSLGVIKQPRYCNICAEEFICKSKTTTHCSNCVKNTSYKITAKNSKTIDQLKSDRTRRKFLIIKYGNKCFICKNTTWNNIDIPIEIDHIDGNSDNNQEENLRLLCPNCHAQTDTYKSKNIGKGRVKRSQRYRAGKTY